MTKYEGLTIDDIINLEKKYEEKSFRSTTKKECIKNEKILEELENEIANRIGWIPDKGNAV